MEKRRWTRGDVGLALMIHQVQRNIMQGSYAEVVIWTQSFETGMIARNAEFLRAATPTASGVLSLNQARQWWQGILCTAFVAKATKETTSPRCVITKRIIDINKSIKVNLLV